MSPVEMTDPSPGPESITSSDSSSEGSVPASKPKKPGKPKAKSKKPSGKKSKPAAKAKKPSPKKPARKAAATKKSRSKAKAPKPKKGPRGGKPGNGTQRQRKDGVKFHVMSVHIPVALLKKLDAKCKKADSNRSAFAVQSLTRALGK